MITAEIRINGQFLGHVYCVNEEGDPDDWCDYSYEYYRPEQGLIKGEVRHFRPNGAAALLKEIFEDIETKGGK